MPFDNIANFFARISGVLLFLLGLFLTAKDTFIEKFFRWIHVGFILDFIYKYNNFLVTGLILIILLRWIRDWRYLAILGLLIFIIVSKLGLGS
ncbi:hypothetical protein HY498_03240 [Candidatus Woesearchaeota archaeon]|nr:hypothetical protein [Candidatus Woesearchaeota archaeon]